MGESASSPEEEELWGRLLCFPFHGGRIADPRVKAGWHVLPGTCLAHAWVPGGGRCGPERCLPRLRVDSAKS